MNVTFRKSSIHGQGVFADSRINRGEWQWVYGEVKPLTMGHCCLKYSFIWGDREDEMYIPFAPWCFLNHSDDPNCEVEEYNGKLTITALKRINAGEELTIDYMQDPIESPYDT